MIVTRTCGHKEHITVVGTASTKSEMIMRFQTTDCEHCEAESEAESEVENMSNRDYWRERQATDATVWMLHQTGQVDLIAEAIADGETPSHVAAQLALLWRTPYARLEKAIRIALREKAEWEKNHA